MTLPLAIRTDLFTPTELRVQARRTRNRRTAMRMLAIANALEGISRAEAARVVGMERQALRDAVIRYNAEGLAGLQDRPKPGRRPRLSEAEQAVLRARILQGPDPARDGCQRWTLPLLCRWIEARFGKRLCTRAACHASCVAGSTSRGRRRAPRIRKPIKKPYGATNCVGERVEQDGE